MLTYQLTSMIIGICVAVVIFWLVRRDHLHGAYAIWWIAAAITVGGLGLFPELFDHLAVYFGIRYPPILAIVLGLLLLLLKVLTMDLERSRQEVMIRRLAQRVAMLEADNPLTGAGKTPTGSRPENPAGSMTSNDPRPPHR